MTPRRILLITLSVLLLTCGGRQPGDPVRPGYNVYSPQQDIELGQQVAAEISKQVDIVKDSALQEYVAAIGRKLAAQPEAGAYPYKFTLINDPAINAFALPGGPIFVHSGLIENADNEAQVAGVLAHEIAHVALRHGTNQASKATLAQIPAVIAGVAIGSDTPLGQLSQIGIGFGLNALFMKYSRTAEKQADALGAKILSQAGYNPVEMARFFEKLEGEGGSRPPQFLSSHPNPGNRVKNVEAELTAFPARNYTTDSGSFPGAKRLVARLPEPKRSIQAAAPVPAAAPRGRVEGFRQLDNGRLRMVYPEGWEVFGDQRSNVTTIAPRQGLVQTQSGGVAIGYGAVLSVYQPQHQRANLSSATRELIGQFQTVNRGLQASGQQQGQIAGHQALLTAMTGSSPYGGRESNLLLTVARPEGLFYMMFVAPEEGLTQMQGTFEQMLNSIEFSR